MKTVNLYVFNIIILKTYKNYYQYNNFYKMKCYDFKTSNFKSPTAIVSNK